MLVQKSPLTMPPHPVPSPFSTAATLGRVGIVIIAGVGGCFGGGHELAVSFEIRGWDHFLPWLCACGEEFAV